MPKGQNDNTIVQDRGLLPWTIGVFFFPYLNNFSRYIATAVVAFGSGYTA